MALSNVASELLVSAAGNDAHECVQRRRHDQLTEDSCGPKVESVIESSLVKSTLALGGNRYIESK